METKNAKITSTMLGYEDHGILSCMLYLSYGGSGQGFGGYCLDSYDKEKEKRIATIHCGVWIAEILKIVGVEKWEDLKGQHIRVRSEHGKVHSIGNLLEDRWFNPEKDLKHLGEA